MNDLSGLILCGGSSSRMGVDKCFLNYYRKPQCYYLYEILKTICCDVFISCNAQQSSVIDEEYNIIEDDKKYFNAGPMTGLLSAFEIHNDKSFLVVGCDYPFISNMDLKKLAESRNENSNAVCYYHPRTGINEPLLTVYEKECYPILLSNFQQGKNSLRNFLDTISTIKINPSDMQSLVSVDTYSEYERALDLIKSRNKHYSS